MKRDSFKIVYNSGASCVIPGYVVQCGKMRIGISNYRHPKAPKKSWAMWDLLSGRPIKFGFDTMRDVESYLTRHYSFILEAVEKYHALYSIFSEHCANNVNPDVVPSRTLLSAKWG